MVLYGANERRNEDLLEEKSGGDWEEGVFIPASRPGSRSNRSSLIHDLVRALLELRPE